MKEKFSVPNNKYGYRWDIQGLRAIAVLGVVIFHINPRILPGGYIGVDVFFVISGYLIIGIIWRDLLKGDFSLIHFYSKRVQRLFPALFILVLVSSIAAYFILLPDETTNFSKSLMATLFYVSNFYFYFEADYFNSAMEFAPLLHTWSLSVEEQFYLIFPIILMLVFSKNKTQIFKVLFVFTILSLLLSQIVIYWDESFAFYSSPTRFFQFTIGGLIAINLQKNTIPEALNDKLGSLGLIVIILCMFIYSNHTLFPGVNALIPTLGTALVLFTGQKSGYVTLLLSNKFFKLIGNSSYSLYLWHWPLIVFYKLEVSPSLNKVDQISLLFLSILFGYISWKYIEKTTRFKYTKYKYFSPIYLATGSILFVIILSLFTLNGMPNRYTEKQLRYAEYLNYHMSSYSRQGKCFLTSSFDDIKYFNKNECISHTKGKKNYLLIGDSHAAHFYSALYENKENNETISQVTASGCKPTLAYRGKDRCTNLVRWAYEELIIDKHFDTIILSARWQSFHNTSLIETVNMLLPYANHIVVFGNSMEYTQPLPRLLAKLSDDEDIKRIFEIAGKYKKLSQLDESMKIDLSMKGVNYISILDIMCDKDKCKTTTLEDIPVSPDYGHFTHEGACYIIEQIRKKLFTR